jgi:hypothetical protein
MNLTSSIRSILKAYILPLVWIFAISIPIMGMVRSIFAAVFVLAGLLVFNLFIRKKPRVYKPGFHWAPAGVSSAGRYAWIFALAAAIILPMFLNGYSLDVFT